MTQLCPACHAPNGAVAIARPRDWEYFTLRERQVTICRCGNCGSLFKDPWPSAREAQNFYGPDYQNYNNAKVPWLASLNAVFQRAGASAFLRRHGTSDISVLDFGCGHGDFLRSLSRLGCCRLAGFDFTPYAGLAAVTGARIFDSIEALAASSERFDVIRMNHVIEHLTDLDKTMRLLAGLLAPAGRIIGETPNGSHYTSRLMRGWWGPLHYPYHTVIFSVEGLAAAAPRWNLRLCETSSSIMPTGWTMSAENMLKAIIGSRKPGRSAGYVALLALGLPFAFLDRLLTPAATAIFGFELSLIQR